MNEKRFIIDCPDWMADWDEQENSSRGLFPEQISTGSRKRVYWKCHVCGGGWITTVKERLGCPYCNGFKALAGFNDLATIHPELLPEWDYERNTLRPEEVTTGSQKKVWWKCKEGHSWDMLVRSRSMGQGCPYCNNRRILRGYNDLATIRPDLAAEWHPTKNGNLKPTDVIPGSKKYAWWKCANGHEWRTQIASRLRGTGCPVCANKAVVANYNDFESEHPELLVEWDFEKNSVPPSRFTSGSAKNVWWICKRGHSWKAAINERSKGSGCPKCSEERLVSFPEKAVLYYLRETYPGVEANYRAEWCAPYEMDMYIPDYRIAIEYDGIYGHSRESGIARDIRKNKVCADHGVTMIRIREDGCPPTGNSIDFVLKKGNDVAPGIAFVIETISRLRGVESAVPDINIERDFGEIYSLIEYSEKENSLAEKAPKIAKLWHPTKNGRLTPEYVHVVSSKTVWWLGECGHEWRSKVSYEVTSGKCPYCTGKRVLKGFNDLATTNPGLAADWDYEQNGDLTPEKITAGSGIKVWWKCGKDHSWRAYVHSRNKGNGCPICANRQLLTGYNDVASYPEISVDWDTERNNCRPEEVCIGTNKKYYWKCCKCGCEWAMSVAARMSGKGCPECTKKKRLVNVSKTYVKRSGSFAENYPDLLAEWDYEKNTVDPGHIVSGYGKKAWWKCSDCGHEWEATVTARCRGNGCPVCGRKKQAESRQNTILRNKKPITDTHPEIAGEWDDERNDGLKACQVTAGSGRRVWWKCKECGTVWQAQICERTRGKGKCPHCRGKNRIEEVI